MSDVYDPYTAALVADLDKELATPVSAPAEASNPTPGFDREAAQAGIDRVLLAPMHGSRPPSQELQKEAGQHRIIVTLKAQGYNNREIARMLGYSDFMVSNTLRQPWARRMLLELINEAGAPGIMNLLSSEAVPSVLRLVDIRDNEKSKGSEVVAACNSLLDRFLGKPVQTVVTDNTNRVEPGTVEALEQELNACRAEEARLKAN